jgi:hypothetical protein
VNLSKSGASLSIGHRGLWYTLGHHRRRVSVGAPGTGLYWTESYPSGAQAPHGGHQAAFIACVLIGLAAVLWAIGGGR